MESYQRGMSLLELMIGLFLGSLLLSAVIINYLTLKKTYHFYHALMEIQEIGQIATQLLTQDIRHSGYSSCHKNKVVHVNANSRIILGAESVIPSELLSRVKANTEVLLLGKINGSGYLVTHDFLIPENWQVAVGDYLLLSNCAGNEIIRIQKIVNQNGFYRIIPNREVNLKVPFEVNRIEQIAYFITEDQNRISNLHRKDLLANQHFQDATLEGVVMMKFRFVVFTHHGLIFKTANKIANWQEIKGIEVNLLLESMTDAYSEPKIYSFLGKTYLSNNLKMHRPWTFFVALKN